MTDLPIDVKEKQNSNQFELNEFTGCQGGRPFLFTGGAP